jgi:tRNA (guanine26-N2/guanine27-N2)-dimethyltransferase
MWATAPLISGAKPRNPLRGQVGNKQECRIARYGSQHSIALAMSAWRMSRSMSRVDRAEVLREGKAKFIVGDAFYNPHSKIIRDLGILAAASYRHQNSQLRVLDAMSGCGVRSLRYWLESGADWVWTNEGNPELNPILQQNLTEAIAVGSCKITHENAHRLFFDRYLQKDYYDLVDVDCFGSAAPYQSTLLWATKIGGLIYLTSTDGRIATGKIPENSLKAYGAYARSHPAAHEQALRLLIGSIQQQAASMGLGVEPIFSLYANKTYRVMLRLVSSPLLTETNYGFLGYCHQCGDYQQLNWRQLARFSCPYDAAPLVISGAMWLGNLHQAEELKNMQTFARQWQWDKQLELLTLMSEESNFPPYFYTLGEIGRRGSMDIPRRSHLIKVLQENGYRATATHLDPQAIKTDANLHSCIKIAKVGLREVRNVSTKI